MRKVKKKKDWKCNDQKKKGQNDKLWFAEHHEKL